MLIICWNAKWIYLTINLRFYLNFSFNNHILEENIGFIGALIILNLKMQNKNSWTWWSLSVQRRNDEIFPPDCLFRPGVTVSLYSQTEQHCWSVYYLILCTWCITEMILTQFNSQPSSLAKNYFSVSTSSHTVRRRSTTTTSSQFHVSGHVCVFPLMSETFSWYLDSHK